LTRAERVVATFVERGESNAEIAARLVLSRRTVESHVSNILAKLGMRSRSDLILAAASRTAPEPPPAAADGMGVVDTAPQ
jgi:DNA-binding NarL/FixJ family response regulator